MKKAYLYSVLILFLIGCTNEKEYKVNLKLLTLSELTLYDKELVSNVIFDAQELNIDSLRDKSREYFLKGVDYYKNKKNPQQAITLFKKSILTFPDAKTYYELGNALFDSNSKSNFTIQEAMKAYKVAEHLNFQPLSSIYLKMALVQSQINTDPLLVQKKDNTNSVLNYLRMAFKNGFSDTTFISNNPYLNTFTSTRAYKLMQTELIANKKDNSPNALFEVFRYSFPPLTNKLEITTENVAQEGNNDFISYDYAKFIPEMENTSFGRDVSHDFMYIAKVAQNNNYTALVYASINYEGEYMQPVHTTLATYNNQGEIISKKFISCQCSAEKIKTATIENDKILIKDYKRHWDKPIDQVPFSKNKVAKFELLTEAKYKINETGEIIDDEVPSNYKDSTVVTLR